MTYWTALRPKRRACWRKAINACPDCRSEWLGILEIPPTPYRNSTTSFNVICIQCGLYGPQDEEPQTREGAIRYWNELTEKGTGK